jgi:hypothetical protein
VTRAVGEQMDDARTSLALHQIPKIHEQNTVNGQIQINEDYEKGSFFVFQCHVLFIMDF